MMQPSGPGFALEVYAPTTPRARALAWGDMSSAERKRAAMRAANEHDKATLAELALAFLLIRGRQHGAASAHTLRAYTAGVGQLVDAWRAENLLHPSPDAGDRYVSMLSERLAPASCASRLAAASALYRGLHWVGATDADPFAGVHAPINRTPRHERRRPYSDEQVAAIAAAADPRLRLVILLTAHGGLRIAECLALTWPEVRLTAGTLRVLSGKGRKARTVHLSATLTEALAAACDGARESEPHVVTSGEGSAARDASWLRRRLALACERAGVEYLGWHAFRHTAGTRLARETGNLQLVAAHLGHADVSTAAIYAKWSETKLASQVASW